MQFRKDESGQMLVLTAFCMTVLMGFLALAIDVGTLFRAKRAVQIAADAGAVAGALEYEYGGTPSPSCSVGVPNTTCAVDNAVAANGIPAADVITVNTNPTDGYHTGSGYVEVVVRQPNPTFFIGAFRGTHTMFDVTARAVAGMAASATCLYVLDPTDADTLYLQGSADLNSPACGIQVDSNSPDAFCDQGSASVQAPYIHIVGGQSSSGKCGKNPGTTVVSGVAPVGDPLNNLLGPSSGNGCSGSNTVTAATVVAATPIPSTSVTTGNTTASVTCFLNGPSNPTTISGTVTLGSPGGNAIFVFENGVTISGTLTVNGTIDIYNGTFTQGNSAVTINAPASSSDTYNGIAIMQPSSDTTASTCDTSAPCLQIQFGSGYGNINGLIYAPTSQVYQQDNGGGTVVSGVIAYQIYLKASTMSIPTSYNAQNPSTTPLAKVELVE
jgi:hypothetical protein